MSETSIDDASLNDMVNSEIGDVDWDAPESGSMPPQAKPGTYDFLFKLEDTPFEDIDQAIRDDKGQPTGETTKNFVVNHKAVITTVTDSGDSKDAEIRFCRVGFKRSEKMKKAHMNARGFELLRSLGLRVDPVTREAIEEAFRGADGRAFGKADFGWQFYCKNCDQTISTNANIKRGEVAWPREADRSYALVVSCPKCGNKGYGRLRLNNYRLPSTPTVTG